LRCAGASAARQRRQSLERRAGSAEMIEQRAKGARADILTADEPQPVEPLLRAPRAAATVSKVSGLT
jgi:hypothetical protein